MRRAAAHAFSARRVIGGASLARERRSARFEDGGDALRWRRCVRAGGERGRGRRSAERGRSWTRAREFRRAACGARVGVRVERAGACESLDKEKPTLSAKTEPRRQGPRKSLTPCVEAFGNVSSRERVWHFRGRLVTVCPYGLAAGKRKRTEPRKNPQTSRVRFPGSPANAQSALTRRATDA